MSSRRTFIDRPVFQFVLNCFPSSTCFLRSFCNSYVALQPDLGRTRAVSTFSLRWTRREGQRNVLPLPVPKCPSATICSIRSHFYHPMFLKSTCVAGATSRLFSSSSRTSDSHFYLPKFRRSAQFKELTPEDVAHFRSILAHPNEQLLQSPDDVELHATDWMKVYRSTNCPLVLKPSTVEELQETLRYCHKESIAVVPQGGNTGLVGGSVPVFDEVVVSTTRMNDIIDFNADTGVLTCDSGCVLETLQNYVMERGYTVPLDLGSKGSCTIGGNVSTNAGGLKMLRYGSLVGNVVGIEAVLADGSLFSSMSGWKKDNTGLKLHELFVGAEGLLGIVTKVMLSCPMRCDSSHLCLFQCDSFEKVCKSSVEVRRLLNEILSAVEFFDAQSLEAVLDHIPGTRRPFPTPSKFYLLVETLGQCSESDSRRVEYLVERLLEQELVKDGIMAESESQKLDMWKLRETINPAMGEQGKVFKFDVTIPLPKMYGIVEHAKRRLIERGVRVEALPDNLRTDAEAETRGNVESLGREATVVEGQPSAELDQTTNSTIPVHPTDTAGGDDPTHFVCPAGDRGGGRTGGEAACAGGEQGAEKGYDAVCVGYGHLGDCNIHLNVLVRNDEKMEDIQRCLHPWVYEFVTNSGGSISSEHGMGLSKAELLSMCKDRGFIAIMKKLKNVFDEKGILNPYKMYRDGNRG
eukprot:GHVQ01005551.1.p1 GENE.GHVQ01005551.1~~GHVQ01005551.1.p1  ORF type:complete len:691 (+),score=97.20 GHVQ01005551.1:1704-3776(+)